MENFANLSIESQQISLLTQTNLDNLLRLNSFYKSIYNTFLNEIMNSSSHVTSILSEQVKQKDFLYSNSTQQEEIYISYLSVILKAQNLISMFNDIIVQPIQLFYSNLSSIYTENLSEFHNMKTSVIETKKRLEKVKLDYFESSKVLANLINNPKSDKNAFSKAKITQDNNAQKYSYEITQANNLYSMYNKKHNYIYSKLYSSEQNRIQFIKTISNKFSNFLKDYSFIHKELSDKVKQLSTLIDIDNDIERMKRDFNFSLYGERFQKEEFKNYIDDINPKMSHKKKLGYENIIGNISISKLSIKNDIISQFILSLFGEKEVEIKQIGIIIELLYNNISYSNKFIDYFISNKKSGFYVLYNLNNLQNLSNIFNIISTLFENQKENQYDISFAIIFIAEKTYCYNKEKNEKIYLSALLSKNKIYSNKKFWISLIEFKLEKKVDEHLTHLMRIDIVKPAEKTEHKSSNFFFFSNITNAIKGAITENRDQSKGDYSLIESSGLNKKIKSYRNLPEYKKPFLDQFASNELHLIIKEFILHICNFGFKDETAIDLIIEVSKKYSISKDKINFYVAIIQSWSYSIKRKLPNERTNLLLLDRINNIKEKRFDLIESKFPIKQSITQMKIEQKNTILILVARYLPLNEIINILSLYKGISRKGRIKIFKELLNRPNLDIKIRLKIWYCLLNITQIKKKYDYNSIKNKLSETNIGNLIPINTINQIKIDVKRTSFSSNEEESKKSLTSVLNAIAFLKPKLNYCQGMNFITSFVIQLLSNEDEAFYLMMGIIEKTEFSLIFMEDLQKLKSFFYIYEKLINLYLPEVFYTFKISNVNVNYFSSPWFITLFTYTITTINPKDPPKVLLKIWDEFFLKSWKALMTTGISLLKDNERKLTLLNYDEILQFLLNSVTSDFFKNENYDRYLKLIKEMKVEKKLIMSLEKEYNFEKKDI